VSNDDGRFGNVYRDVAVADEAGTGGRFSNLHYGKAVPASGLGSLLIQVSRRAAWRLSAWLERLG
tara:strand:+ start:11874 stop:12068 length:195 start_codon:yes stop_codon:yes gene_type:complete